MTELKHGWPSRAERSRDKIELLAGEGLDQSGFPNTLFSKDNELWYRELGVPEFVHDARLNLRKDIEQLRSIRRVFLHARWTGGPFLAVVSPPFAPQAARA